MGERRQTQHNKRLVLQSLEKSLGIVTTACKNAGVDRATFYSWLKKDAKFAAQVKDIEEIAIDFVESKLFKRIEEGSDAATIFFMKCKAKKRGYIERNEFTGADGAPLFPDPEFCKQISEMSTDEKRAQLEQCLSKNE